MPPKRKQADDTAAAAAAPATSTRSTRTSTKSASSKNTASRATTKAGTLSTDVAGDGSDAESPQTSKKRKTNVASKKSSGKGTKKKGGQAETDVPVVRKPLPPIDYATTMANGPNFFSQAPKTSPSKKSKYESYTQQRALALFGLYADEDTKDVIGVEGFEKLCKDAEMSMEGTRPLIFCWQMQAKEMGKITKDEWLKGLATLQIGSIPGLSLAMEELDDLLFSGKKSKATGKEYDRTHYSTCASNPDAAFHKLYMFSFNLVKPEQSKNIDMETSLAFWTVLLIPKYELMGEIIRFIKEKEGTYKATNKDLWSMMLEFCETVNPTLQDYDADGAWPTLLDDFVSWKSIQLNGGQDDKMDVSEAES